MEWKGLRAGNPDELLSPDQLELLFELTPELEDDACALVIAQA